MRGANQMTSYHCAVGLTHTWIWRPACSSPLTSWNRQVHG